MVFLLGCATADSAREDAGGARDGGGARAAAPGFVHQGRASFYSRALAGRKTASGERYDPRLYTAAHRTLPLGTWIRVTRPNGASVDVKVNDRCGCGGGRIVDLSEAAARQLDMIRAGVVPVRLEVISKKS